MIECSICCAPIVQRTTTGEYWCSVYGRHGLPRWDEPSPPPAPPTPPMRWDGSRWRSSAV